MKKLLILCCTVFVSALTVKPQPITKQLLLRGQISAENTYNIQLPFDTKITQTTPYGHVVNKGDTLFTIDYISSDNSSLLNLIHSYFDNKSTMMLQAAHMQAQQELLEIQAISQKSYQESIHQYEKKHLDMLNAKHTLENMLSHYDASIEDIDPLFGQSLSTIDTYIQAKIPQKIYAQHAGILLPVAEDKTNNMSAYHKKFTDIASIIDHHSFKIDLYIHEKDINKVFTGQQAQITINALQTTISGEVTNVLNYPSTSHPNQYQVQVKFSELTEEQLGTLKVGMGCSVNILLSEYEALLVPIASVKTIMGQNMVTVIDEAKKMTQREVKLGVTQGMQIEILDGLEAGEEIFEYH